MKPLSIIHPESVVESGLRARRGKGSFRSLEAFECPRCGRIEYGNVYPERVVMCSMCFMGLAMAKGMETPGKDSVKPSMVRNGRIRKCERCREDFRGRSNAQRFCDGCQQAAYRNKARGWDKDKRKFCLKNVPNREIEAI